jgi:hypothetical protein
MVTQLNWWMPRQADCGHGASGRNQRVLD